MDSSYSVHVNVYATYCAINVNTVQMTGAYGNCAISDPKVRIWSQQVDIYHQHQPLQLQQCGAKSIQEIGRQNKNRTWTFELNDQHCTR